MRASSFILFAFLMGPSTAGAQKLDCDLIEFLLGPGQIETLKGAPLGFNVWRSDLKINGFERCSISDVSTGEDGSSAFQSTIECEVRMPTEEAAGRLAHDTIEALTSGCGRTDTLIAPTFGEAGIMALDPLEGLGLQTSSEAQLFDFSGWRSELRADLDETTIPKHRLTLTVMIVETP